MMWLQENSAQLGETPPLSFPCTLRMEEVAMQSEGHSSPVSRTVCWWGGQLLWKGLRLCRCTPLASKAGCRLPVGSGLWPEPSPTHTLCRTCSGGSEHSPALLGSARRTVPRPGTEPSRQRPLGTDPVHRRSRLPSPSRRSSPGCCGATACPRAAADGCCGPVGAALGILLLHTQADCPPDGTAYSLRNI